MNKKIDVEFTDRYQALGIPHPGDNCCSGQCEGTGWVPIYMSKGDNNNLSSARIEDETSKMYITLWEEAEIMLPTDDGWHFVPCPICHGTGRK